MFQSLSQKFSSLIHRFGGEKTLTEDNIRDTVSAIRRSLLEADVALVVVKSFTEQVLKRAIGEEIPHHMTAGQMLVKIFQEEIENILGQENSGLTEAKTPPTVILLAGLQGVGKTTTAAKLGYLLRVQQRKKVLITSVDITRPAAITQLMQLCTAASLDFFTAPRSGKVKHIAKDAFTYARKRDYDILIVDTAGRLHVNADMMHEISMLHKVLSPRETLFVVDAMNGQDAINTARAFGEALPLSGLVLTKADSDTRGGAALSALQVTGRPIKYLGNGEKIENFEIFHPQRMASRILGMGDVLSLIEQVERNGDEKKQQRLFKKIQKKGGKGLNFHDLQDQIQQVDKLGGVGALLQKLPGSLGNQTSHLDAIGQQQNKITLAMIASMTEQEKSFPELVEQPTRKRRITNGSGTRVQDFNRLLKQMKTMRKMLKKKSAKNPMRQLAQQLNGMQPSSFYNMR